MCTEIIEKKTTEVCFLIQKGIILESTRDPVPRSYGVFAQSY